MPRKEVKEFEARTHNIDGKLAVVVREVIAKQPRKLDDLSEVRDVMNAYLTRCEDDDLVPCVAGLARSLGVSKGTLDTSFKGRGDAESELYAMFMTVLEDWAAQRLFKEGGKSAVAAMFYLKQMGWRDDGVRSSSDNRSVTQIVITNGKGLEAVDVISGQKTIKKIQRKRGRPKKYNGTIDISSGEVEDAEVLD